METAGFMMFAHLRYVNSGLYVFTCRFDDEINSLVARAPLILKPRRRKADIDTNNDIPATLPSPLSPQQLHG